MTMRTALVFLGAVGLASAAHAQTKISGTVTCAKPEKAFNIPVEGEQGHLYAISQGTCTWTKPMELAGTKTKADVFTNYDDIQGGSAHGHGDGVGTLENGDQFRVRIEGKSLLKDTGPVSSEGKWKFMGGTGVVKSVTGGGTYTCKAAADGAMTCDVSGDYSVPKK
jgi:hypothetical protein